MNKQGGVRERKWPFAFLPTLWVIGAFVLASVIVDLGINLLRAAGVPLTNVDQDTYMTLASATIYVLLVGITLGVPRLLKLWSARTSFRALLGFTREMQWRDILYAGLGFVVYLALGVGVILLVAALVPGFNPSQVQNTGFTKVLSPNNAILVFLSLVIIAPIAEEIIFRGYLFGTLRRIVPLWVAALVTSLVFAAIHLQWNVGVDVFVMSMVSCFLRYKTGSLWASILLHMAKNGLAFYTLYIATSAIMK